MEIILLTGILKEYWNVYQDESYIFDSKNAPPFDQTISKNIDEIVEEISNIATFFQ